MVTSYSIVIFSKNSSINYWMFSIQEERVCDIIRLGCFLPQGDSWWEYFVASKQKRNRCYDRLE